jgi:transaldolase
LKIFIDTANIEEIKEINEMGFLAGVTTNPTLIAKEGRDYHQVIQEICGIVNGPISAEVISLDYHDMVREGRELAAIHPNVVIKVPLSETGLKVIHAFKGLGIATNATLVFSAHQALLAARSAYVLIEGQKIVPQPIKKGRIDLVPFPNKFGHLTSKTLFKTI